MSDGAVAPAQRRRAQLTRGLAVVRSRIADACAAAGRDPSEVTMVAVTKTYPASDVLLLAGLGVRDVGENRDQEAAPKAAETAAAGAEVRWHFVGRLQRKIRDPRCSFEKSLETLRGAKRLDPSVFTKSSLMLGLGESHEEVVESLQLLRAAGVEFLTLGQYLRPSPKHAPVREYVAPERFDAYQRLGLELGFLYVASGPLVRSSYHADEQARLLA